MLYVPVGPPDLVPSCAGNTGQSPRPTGWSPALVRAEVPVSEPKGRPLPVGQDVQILRMADDAGLRQAVAGRWCTRIDRVKGRCRQLCGESYRSCGVRTPLNAQLPNVECVECRAITCTSSCVPTIGAGAPSWAGGLPSISGAGDRHRRAQWHGPVGSRWLRGRTGLRARLARRSPSCSSQVRKR